MAPPLVRLALVLRTPRRAAKYQYPRQHQYPPRRQVWMRSSLQRPLLRPRRRQARRRRAAATARIPAPRVPASARALLACGVLQRCSRGMRARTGHSGGCACAISSTYRRYAAYHPRTLHTTHVRCASPMYAVYRPFPAAHAPCTLYITLQEVIDATVLYLSPHYRHLPASGSGGTGTTGQGDMYAELSAQLSALGIKVVSTADATSLAERRALFLLVLCPGKRTHSEQGCTRQVVSALFLLVLTLTLVSSLTLPLPLIRLLQLSGACRGDRPSAQGHPQQTLTPTLTLTLTLTRTLTPTPILTRPSSADLGPQASQPVATYSPTSVTAKARAAKALLAPYTHAAPPSPPRRPKALRATS